MSRRNRDTMQYKRHQHRPPPKRLPRQDSRTLNIPQSQSREERLLSYHPRDYANTT